MRFTALVQDVITYEKRNFYNSVGRERTPYQGKPSPEVDDLWSNLYEGKHVLGPS